MQSRICRPEFLQALPGMQIPQSLTRGLARTLIGDSHMTPKPSDLWSPEKFLKYVLQSAHLCCRPARWQLYNDKLRQDETTPDDDNHNRLDVGTEQRNVKRRHGAVCLRSCSIVGSGRYRRSRCGYTEVWQATSTTWQAWSTLGNGRHGLLN